MKRLVGLDIMRSIAILIVIYEHAKHYVPSQYLEVYNKVNIFKIDGVTIFFVLSGYLIGGIFIREFVNEKPNALTLSNFWIRRWFRTLPNYFLVLFILVFLTYMELGNFDFFNFKYLFFFQNFSSPHPKFFPEAWSLSIEEWFYFLYPLLYFIITTFLRVNRLKVFLTLTVLFFITPLIIRLVIFDPSIETYSLSNIRGIVIYRLDSLMYGVIAAYIHAKNIVLWDKIKKAGWLLGLILLITLYNNKTLFNGPFLFNIECIISFLFLPILQSLKSTKLLIVDRVFIFISKTSYSLYLLNLTFMQSVFIPILENKIEIFKNIPPAQFYIKYLVYIFFTFLFSYLLFYFYEKPTTKLRDFISK